MINKVPFPGSLPSLSKQLDYPRLVNSFLDSQEFINRLPVLTKVLDLLLVEAIHYSFTTQTYFIATRNTLYKYTNLTLTSIGDIQPSDKAYRFAENNNNQVVLVNGLAAYVYSQKTSTLVKLGPANNFNLQQPIDVIVLDTIAIIGDKLDNKWIISFENDALNYNSTTPQLLDPRSGSITGFGDVNNNLFIFAENMVERWVPVQATTSTVFPFLKDASFRNDYGAISTASINSYNNAIYYFSNDGHVRTISQTGARELTTFGIANILKSKPNLHKVKAIYYNHKGLYFYHLSFDDEAWVYNSSLGTWSESSSLFIDASNELVLQKDIIGKLGVSFSPSDYVTIRSNYFSNFLTQPKTRVKASQILLNMSIRQDVEGPSGKFELDMSQDNVHFGPKFTRFIQNNADSNIIYEVSEGVNAAHGITIRVTFWYQYDFVVRGVMLLTRS